MAKLLQIITNPNPILRKRSAEVEPEKIASGDFKALCRDMEKTMVKKDGVGLAAPQIGKNIRVITVNTKDGAVCMINPKITRKSFGKEWGEEGCLSVPGIFGEVERHLKISYNYFDTNGKKIKANAYGFMARVIQHEVDHIDGILFIDKARDIKKIDKQ